MTRGRGLLALSPLIVFLGVYLVSSFVAKDFYKVPVVAAFLLASAYALFITKGGIDERVAQFSRPYLKEVAPYLLSRAQLLMDMGRNRQAVSDLNDYEDVMKAQVNSNFYYMRFRVEMEGRLFQQALNDIEKAITMTPQSDLYYAEKASLQVRVGYYDEAIETAKTCIQLAPEHSDGYLFMGLAQCLKGQKTEGLKNLQKAKELGDVQAEELIEKYSK